MKRWLFIGLGGAALSVAAVVATLGGPREMRPKREQPEPMFQERLKQMSRQNEWKEAHEWYMMDKLYPDFRIDASHYEEAGRVMERLEPARERSNGRGRRLPIGNWAYVGPKRMEGPFTLWFGPHLASGRLNSVFWDPNDENTLLVTARGGIFRTNDLGGSWTPLNNGWPSVMSSAVAVHPTNPNLIYAGTGDYVGKSVYSGGIMRTTNTPGFWWQITPDQTSEGPVSDLVLHPDDPMILLSTTGNTDDGRIRRSDDGGDTWRIPHVEGTPITFLPKGDWCDIETSIPDSRGNRKIYASRTTHQAGVEVWVSKDQGVSFKKVVVRPPLSAYKTSLAASRIDPSRVYALVSGKLILRSDDGGDTWTNIVGDFRSDWFTQISYNYCLETVRLGDDGAEALVVGQSGLFMCKNPEAASDWTWEDLGLTHVEGPPGFVYRGSPSRLHCDIHILERNPHRPNQFFVGSDGGAYLMTLDRSGEPTTQSIGALLPTTMFYHAAFHPTEANVMLGGLQDNSTASTSKLSGWGDLEHWKTVGAGDGGYAAINPADPRIQYASWQYGAIMRTKDAWSSWNVDDIAPASLGKPSGASFLFLAPLQLDPGQPNHLYVASGSSIHRWNETTSAWTPKVLVMPNSAEAIRTIHMPVGAPNRMYVGTFDGRFFAGDTNTGQLVELTKSNTPKLSITDIHVHPSDLNSVLVTFGGVGDGHVYEVELTGGTLNTLDAVWADKSGSGWSSLPDIPANTIERDPFYPQSTWYVGTDVGVLMTNDAGVTWKNASGILGLPSVEVRHLEYVPGTGYLNCATYGRGMFRLRLAATFIQGYSVGREGGRSVGGMPVRVRIDLSEAAPSGGARVLLGAFQRGRTGDLEPTNLVNMPESVTIPEGQTSVEIMVETMTVASPRRILTQAQLGSEILQAEVDLLPATMSVRVEPSDLLGGAPAEGRVDLESPAPAGGTRVSLTSSREADLSVPTEVVVPEGMEFATFAITTRRVTSDQTVQVTATEGSNQATATVSVRALRIIRIELDRNSLVGGGRMKGRVHISGLAQDNENVLLRSLDSVVQVPSEVTVPRGTSMVEFEVSSSMVGAPVQVELQAERDGVVTTLLTVEPRRIAGSVVYRDVRSLFDLGQPLTVQFLQPGTGTVIEESVVVPDPFGRFSVQTPALAEFDVSTKVRHWLRRTIPVRTGGNVDVAFDLYNGDVNGDNSVNVADFLVLRGAFGTSRGNAGYNLMADLNEDGTVGIPDFLILRANFGAQGD